MKIECHNGKVHLFYQTPIFMGTTGKTGYDSQGRQRFPEIGTPMGELLSIYPCEGDSGTLVFKEPLLPGVHMPTYLFVQFRWEKGEVVATKGFKTEDHTRLLQEGNPTFGYFVRVGISEPINDCYTMMYCTEMNLKRKDPGAKLVTILDLVRFAENKINHAEIAKRVIEKK